MDAAQGENIFRPRLTPEHARLFATGPDDGFASGLDHTRTDEETFAPEGPVLHALHVVDEVTQSLFHGRGLGRVGAFLARFGNEFLHLVLEQSLGPASEPGFVI